jgi:hypothetical protein
LFVDWLWLYHTLTITSDLLWSCLPSGPPITPFLMACTEEFHSFLAIRSWGKLLKWSQTTQLTITIFPHCLSSTTTVQINWYTTWLYCHRKNQYILIALLIFVCLSSQNWETPSQCSSIPHNESPYCHNTILHDQLPRWGWPTARFQQWSCAYVVSSQAAPLFSSDIECSFFDIAPFVSPHLPERPLKAQQKHGSLTSPCQSFSQHFIDWFPFQ